MILAAAALTGYLKPFGPTHIVVTPAEIGTYARTVALERQTNVAQLRNEVIKESLGQASRVVTAVYESGIPTGSYQIILFIGGRMSYSDPVASILSFTQRFQGSWETNTGSLGGKAACVEEAAGTADNLSMCAWFDNDSFGEIVSPTMNAAALAKTIQTVRPAVEILAKR